MSSGWPEGDLASLVDGGLPVAKAIGRRADAINGFLQPTTHELLKWLAVRWGALAGGSGPLRVCEGGCGEPTEPYSTLCADCLENWIPW